MEYSIYQTPKTVHCKLYDKQMTIYLIATDYNGKRYIRSNGCEQMHSSPECKECLSRELRISSIPPQEPQEPS